MITDNIHRNLKNGLFGIIFLCVAFLPSCKKENVHQDINPNPQSLGEIFDSYWYKMNSAYVYWDIDETDWDVIYDIYHPLFNKLNNDKNGQRIAFGYLKEISSKLIDGHYQISFNNEPLLSVKINPSLDRKSSDPSFHRPYNYLDLIPSYLDKGYLLANGSVIGTNTNLTVVSGTIGNNVLYFRCNSFYLKRSVEFGDKAVVDVLSNFFSKLNTASRYRGIIIDLRNNLGGDIQDLNFFAGKLIKESRIFGYTRNTSGFGRGRYLPWMDAHVIHDPNYHNPYKIVVLTDNFTASMSETLIVSLKADKNCIVIGEQTYGATGPLMDPQIFNSGTFEVGNFMTVQTSAVEFKTLENKVIESYGITPDIKIPFNVAKLAIGIDLQLEKGLEVFKVNIK